MAPIHVLVVDDEALIRWALSETFAGVGYAVTEAVDAETALRALRDASGPFDVVLLDLRLPDSEDLTLLAAIRRCRPGTPVILMTAFATPDVIKGALELGAFRIISKPVDMHVLAALVAEAHASRAH